MPVTQGVQDIPLHLATRERYLNYALSVITSRALPDVRDGLKPVQRRILYTMFNEMSLHPNGRYRKCAAVVGEVMGKFHPHGDQSIYDALTRMSQDFSLRAPLIDGQGNFGSLDGDRAAAMRYTECRLRPIAEELISEIRKGTVDFRPNYDGQRSEPIVLPSQFPQLLVNGCEGIAVGMATRIPPHNLGEVIDAAIALANNGDLSVRDLMGFIHGPDFPTSGHILAETADLVEIYERGQGSFRIRAEYEVERANRRKLIILTSVPYGQNKARLIERIGQEVRARKLPQVMDVRDESTDIVRIVLELKQGTDPDTVMAYLFRRTPLETSWSINFTVLLPTSRPETLIPGRVSLKEILSQWLQFRFTTIKRRLEFDLARLKERIHILEGFESIFDELDKAIQLIRKSDGKKDAGRRIKKAFELSDLQVEAILELKLYRLAKLEIDSIREELEEKRTEASAIEVILASKERLWTQVIQELKELRKLYADPRRTTIGKPETELTFKEDEYIVKEDTFVVVTRDGWIKRQSSFSNIDKIRIRDGDEIGWLIRANTRSTMSFYSSHGAAYVIRVAEVPSTTGYGEPLQRYFGFDDGEKVVGVISNDDRHAITLPEGTEIDPEMPPPPYPIAITIKGKSLRFSQGTHSEVSTRNGRKYARLGGGDSVIAVYQSDGTEHICLATRRGRTLIFPVGDVGILKSSGKGTMGIKLRPEDRVMAFELAKSSLDGPTVITAQGRELVVRERKFGIAKRAGRGKVVLKRGTISEWLRESIIQLGNTGESRIDTPEEEEGFDPDQDTEEIIPTTVSSGDDEE